MTENSGDWQRLSRLLDQYEKEMLAADEADLAGLDGSKALVDMVSEVIADTAGSVAAAPSQRRRVRRSRSSPANPVPVRTAFPLRGAAFSTGSDENDEEDEY